MMNAKFYLSCLTVIGLVFTTQTTRAQTYQPSNRTPVADTTLGTQVSGTGNNFDITGGVGKGQTLFHSFTDFSVPTNGQANFRNPVGNRDIITRVTGNVFSDINGLVNTNGANFFLINPNGIVFGTNARLDVGKAFFGSTANSLDLVDAGGRTITFGTNANGDAPLLSVAPNVLFDVSRLNFNGGTGAISNFGTLQTTNILGQYIGLIGGKVSIDGGQISTPSGRLELGGLSAPGSIELTTAGNIPKLKFSASAPGGIEITTEGKIPKLNFPANVPRSDVSITNGAVIDTIGIGGGDVFVTARNLEILGSSLNAGIIVGLESTTVGGDIKLDATGTMLINGSSITNQLQSTADGKGGNTTINANSLSVSNASIISNDTLGRGNAGNITIAVTDAIDLKDKSFIFGSIEAGAVGNGGNIDINAGSLSLRDGSRLAAATYGKGDAGKVAIDIKGNLSLNNGSSINSSIVPQAEGKSQGISIIAKNINLSNSAILSDNFGGIGNAGNIDIKTTGDLTIAGDDRSVPTIEKLNFSAISSSTSGKGDAGKITIEAGGILSLNNNGLINAQIFEKGEGNSQGIAINAKDISLSNFSSIFTDNLGTGNAGNIDIKTTGDLTIVGSDRSIPLVNGADAARIFNSSSISSNSRGKGDSGKITIDTQGNVSLNNRAFISSEILRAEGNSQKISINTKNLRVKNNSEITTSNQGSIGDAGNIDIKTTGDIEIAGLTDISLSQNGQDRNVSVISATNLDGRGNSGNINIESKGNIGLSDAFISSLIGGTGNSGNINIESKGNIGLSDAIISSFSGGEGQAANISISSQKLNLSKMSFITTDGFSVGGGNITLAIGDLLLLRNNSLISSRSLSAGEDGNGGNITISSPLIVALPGDNNITANAFQGTGGNVRIASQGLFGIKFRAKGQDSPVTNDITASSTFGQNGTVNIDTPGTDPGQDSTELPNTTTDASNQISQACSTNNRQNKLTVTGRGGLPPNANDPLTSDVVWQDARAVSSPPAISSTTTTPAKFAPPAVGWVFDGKGKVMLIAAGTQGQPTGTSVVCPNVVK